jgi:hypothetical protein
VTIVVEMLSTLVVTCVRMLKIDDIRAEELLEPLWVGLTTLLAR